MRRNFLSLGLIVVFVLFGSWAVAQVTTGTILGTVSDSTGAVVPGASVAVRNVETGIARTVTTDAAGRYRAAQLGLGNYEVTAEVAGFQTVVRSGITLTVGREATVDFTLQVGAVTERITVTGEAPLVETTGSTVSSVVEGTSVRELPLNGRSFEQLAILQPGVFLARGRSDSISYGGGGAWISISGARQVQSATLYDGTNINGVFNRAGLGVGGRLLGVDAIREFRVLTTNVTAEYLSVVGGVVNVVTRSGTNEFHGSGFEFLRNSALDAKNFFDRPDPTPIPAFKRNQFGVSVGGPIKKDKTFFFGVYEGLRDRLGRTVVAPVPNAKAREGYLPNAANPSVLDFVGVAPGVKPYLDLYPLPNGRDRGDGTAEITASATQPTNQNFWQARLDHQLSANHSIFGRYTSDKGDIAFPTLPFQAAQGFPPRWPGNAWNHYATLQFTSIISPTVLNNARVGFARVVSTESRPTEPAILRHGVPRPETGRLSVGGLVNIAMGQVTRTVRNSFEYADDVTVTRGAHSFKFGGLIDRYQDILDGETLIPFRYIFNNLRDFLQKKPFSFDGALLGADPIMHWRQILFGFYGQDDWRVNPRLTLNLGLRYEFVTNPINVNSAFGGGVSVLKDPLHDKALVFEEHPYEKNPSLKNLMPRFGFAWDAFGDGKTAVRGGFGITYEQILAMYYVFMHWSPPFQRTWRVLNPIFPNQIDLAGTANPLIGINEVTPWDTSRNPKVLQFNLALQRELPGNMAIQVGYVGSRGNNLAIATNINTPLPKILPDGQYFTPPGSTFRNPAFGELHWRPFEAISWYSALQLTVQKRMSRGWLWNANYTFSRNTDDSSEIHAAESTGLAEGTQNPDCRSCDHALSNYQREHAFNLTTSYELPFGRNLTGIQGALGRGWEVSLINQIQSGLPFSARVGFDRAGQLATSNVTLQVRPNLRPGMSNNPTEGVTAGCLGVAAGRKLGDPDLWYDPCAFQLQPAGFFGNVGRNTVIAPGLVNFDFTVIKNTHWGERYNLQYRAEFFNIFNHPSFSAPQREVFLSPTGIPSGSAGRITSTATTSRQIQFGLKLIF